MFGHFQHLLQGMTLSNQKENDWWDNIRASEHQSIRASERAPEYQITKQKECLLD
jgi:hypothetical protein